MSIQLEIVEGPLRGQSFTFEGRDTFLFGRAPDAHCSVPEDGHISRHHFLLEIQPPDVVLRDLGSMNGTRVNGCLHGSRQGGGERQETAVVLNNGDRIRAGQTVFQISMDVCSDSPTVRLSPDRQRDVLLPGPQRMRKKRPVCARCGRPVVGPAAEIQGGCILCVACQKEDSSLPPLERARISDVPCAPAGAPEVPGHTILRKLGEGGMGAVYLARNDETGAQVAVKVMLPSVRADEEEKKSFQREVQITKRLRHENIIAFLEEGFQRDAFYLVLEYAARGNVMELMEAYEGRLPLGVAAPLMQGALKGLAYAHGRGFVHRDLKPPNLLLGETDERLIAKIGDFGLAKNFEMAGLSGMTMTGTVGGTVTFMPPEQITHYKYVYPASDVFSIGATFYYMLAGRIHYHLPPGADPIVGILEGNTIPLRTRVPEVPEAVEAVIQKALQPDACARYESAIDMETALAKALATGTR